MAEVLAPQEATVDVVVVSPTHSHHSDGEGTGAAAGNVEATAAKTKEIKENGEAPKATAHESSSATEAEAAHTEDAAAKSDAAAVAPEKKAEEVVQKVTLNQFPPVKTLPSVSAFCLKVETYLRMNKIPYENHYGFKAGKKGKLPWIEYKNDKVPDSSMIVEYLNKTFEVDVDKDLSDEQRAIGRAVQVMLEENTYFAIVYQRWVDDTAEFKKFVQPPSGSGLTFSVFFKMMQRRVKAQLDHQGIGRHSRDEIYGIACKDLKALATLLGDKPFLLGHNPTTYDCVVFGFVAQLVFSGLESPLSKFVIDHCQNLVEYATRMKQAFWSDWEDMIQGDKQEVSLKKGFSFRRSKKKQYKVKKEEEKAAEGEKVESECVKPAEEAPAGSCDQACSSGPVSECEKAPEEECQEKPPAEAEPQHHHVNGDATEEEKAKTEE